MMGGKFLRDGRKRVGGRESLVKCPKWEKKFGPGENYFRMQGVEKWAACDKWVKFLKISLAYLGKLRLI
jgi:hypothetical protein